jgi:hypothetical protein
LRRSYSDHTYDRPPSSRLVDAGQENDAMRRPMLIAGVSALLISLAAGPALAGFGALARDDSTGKFGLSSNEESATKAADVAVKICGSDKCKVVFKTAPKECGAIAVAETGTGWGAGKGQPRARAELDAMTNCQKHTKGQCKLRSAECNR